MELVKKFLIDNIKEKYVVDEIFKLKTQFEAAGKYQKIRDFIENILANSDKILDSHYEQYRDDYKWFKNLEECKEIIIEYLFDVCLILHNEYPNFLEVLKLRDDVYFDFINSYISIEIPTKESYEMISQKTIDKLIKLSAKYEKYKKYNDFRIDVKIGRHTYPTIEESIFVRGSFKISKFNFMTICWQSLAP